MGNNEKNQRIVITGGSGFIGSFLVQKLIEKGFSRILVIDKNPNPQQGACFLTCDVFSNVALLEDTIQEGDVVIHLACNTMPSISEKNSTQDALENIAGTVKLLDICKNKKIKKFIFASSGGTVYGSNCKKKNTEDDETHPKNSYGVVKLAIEKYLGVYEHIYGLKHVICRISNPYGRKHIAHKKLGAVDVFLHNIIEEKDIVIWGDGTNVRDYIHVDDVVDFFIHAIKKNNIKGIYNVGTGKGTSLKQIIDIISTTLQKKVTPQFTPERSVDVTYSVLNIDKAKLTGWQPKHSIEKGIEEVYRNIRNQ